MATSEEKGLSVTDERPPSDAAAADDDDRTEEEDCDVVGQLLEGDDDDDDDDDSDVAEKRYRTGTGTEYRDISTELIASAAVVDDDDDDNDDNADLPLGMPATCRIIHHATMPPEGFTMARIEGLFTPREIERLKLIRDDVTVPAALMLLLPDVYDSQTRARKDSRRRRVLVHRGPLNDLEGEGGADLFDREILSLARVGDRVRPGDTIAIQTRMEHNYGECRNHDDEPPFHLPVVYEDDHLAIVNKPEGIVVFGHKNGGFGRNSVKACLPWVLTPPVPGLISVMRRPQPVHRIDRGTSGLLVCAKTKPAMTEISRQFKERKVKKTYTAIVNGDIEEPDESSISADEATNLGVCIGDEGASETLWQIIDEDLEDQSAVTIWRTLRRYPLENARNGTVALVELKPKTGRFHQLRRHMAWVSKCPLLGDKQYDGGGLAKTLRDQGFYLCSNRVTLEHPYYNTPQGRKEWETKKGDLSEGARDGDGKRVRVVEGGDGVIMVHCEIDLPPKFNEF